MISAMEIGSIEEETNVDGAWAIAQATAEDGWGTTQVNCVGCECRLRGGGGHPEEHLQREVRTHSHREAGHICEGRRSQRDRPEDCLRDHSEEQLQQEADRGLRRKAGQICEGRRPDQDRPEERSQREANQNLHREAGQICEGRRAKQDHPDEHVHARSRPTFAPRSRANLRRPSRRPRPSRGTFAARSRQRYARRSRRALARC